MTDELLVAIRAEWEAAGRPIVRPHAHRDDVTFADGTTVVGVRFLVDDPYKRDQAPTFGLYLDQRWAPPWDHAHLPWVDFGVPDANELRVALEDVLDRSRRGEHVEIGCLGGHGRTGTALACLAVLTGGLPGDAVAWIRAAYCEKAVETDEQREFVAAFRQEPVTTNRSPHNSGHKVGDPDDAYLGLSLPPIPWCSVPPAPPERLA